MARASSRSQAERHKQRISKHDLAKAVARHFKEASVGGPEGDSVVELVYKVRFGGEYTPLVRFRKREGARANEQDR